MKADAPTAIGKKSALLKQKPPFRPPLGSRVDDMKGGFAFEHTSDEVLVFKSPPDLNYSKQKTCQLQVLRKTIFFRYLKIEADNKVHHEAGIRHQNGPNAQNEGSS